jgi:two-component system heavy metal sensor histidine kinase CusS
VLERLLVPLLDNALRYAHQHIIVEVTALSHTATIDITDDGPGIPDTALAHLFEPGWRAQPEDGHTGAGLGLALAHRLAASAGGSITAVDTTAGARFMITLPRA